MRLPDEYFIERNVGDLKIPILCPENCNQSGASISAKMLVTWLKKRFYFRLHFILISLRLRSVSFQMVRYTRYRDNCFPILIMLYFQPPKMELIQVRGRLRQLFTQKILSSQQERTNLCPLQSAARISMTQNLL